MERAKSSLLVRSDLTVRVQITDELYRPIVHRYLDTLVRNLRNALLNINFYQVACVEPVVSNQKFNFFFCKK